MIHRVCAWSTSKVLWDTFEVYSRLLDFRELVRTMSPTFFEFSVHLWKRKFKNWTERPVNKFIACEDQWRQEEIPKNTTKLGRRRAISRCKARVASGQRKSASGRSTNGARQRGKWADDERPWIARQVWQVDGGSVGYEKKTAYGKNDQEQNSDPCGSGKTL